MQSGFNKIIGILRLGHSPSLRMTCQKIHTLSDEASLREPVRDYLDNLDYRVLDTENGLQALKLIESHTGAIDVLLTDVIMPQLNGPDLARMLKHRFPSLKIIFMSGYAEDKLGQIDVSLDSVLLQKPFTLRSLRDKLQQLLVTNFFI